MLIKGWMSTDVVVVDEETSVMKASQIMKEHRIRRLPVLRNGKLIGIVSDRDIKEASPSKATTLDVHELYYLLSELKIKDIMTPDPITIGPEETVELAAVKMLEHNVSGLPVLRQDGQLVGILTMNDVFKVLISITGIYRGGIQFAFALPDRPGSIGEVANVIRAHGGSMVSILSSYDSAEEDSRNVFIRIKDMPEDRLKALVDELEQNFVLLYTTKDQLKDV
ncbi:MAG: CBS domain-containing protein [Deltaproteobacteria bacterium]|nr:CBS domain-containing protein [Deltaproteobacteria bacterium]